MPLVKIEKRKSIFHFLKQKKVWIPLISLAVALIFGTAANFYYKDLMVQPVRVQAKTMDKNVTAKADFKTKNVVPINENEVAIAGFRNRRNPDRNIQIGALAIPDIGLKLNIYKGIGGDHLWLGACTYREESVMGEGNYVLLAHNTVNPNLLFSPLRRSESGMKAFLTDGHQVYEYEIQKNIIVFDFETSYADSKKTDKKLTMITCYGGEGTIKRRIVIAQLNKIYPIEGTEIF